MRAQRAAQAGQVVILRTGADDVMSIREDQQIADAIGRQLEPRAADGGVEHRLDAVEPDEPICDRRPMDIGGDINRRKRSERAVVRHARIGDRAYVSSTPAPRSARSLSFAVTAATLAPAAANAARIVGARRNEASFIVTAWRAARSRKKLPLMPWIAGGTPVTIETLLGFVKVGTAASATRMRPCSISEDRNGATPARTAAWMYSHDDPSRHTTTTGRKNRR